MDLYGSRGAWWRTVPGGHIVTMAGWMLSLTWSVCVLTPVLGVLLESYKDVKGAYDYVIVGGGTAGLTVADRLSESGKHSVLVVEYGYLGKSQPQAAALAKYLGGRQQWAWPDYVQHHLCTISRAGE